MSAYITDLASYYVDLQLPVYNCVLLLIYYSIFLLSPDVVMKGELFNKPNKLALFTEYAYYTL